MRFSNTNVYNFSNAIRGMRNPHGSWNKSDSVNIQAENGILTSHVFALGKDDLKLARKLVLAGTDHSKFMRQISVCVDIEAPLYFWKQLDQYKVGVTTNSCSTMHTLASREITPECFDFGDVSEIVQDIVCGYLERYRKTYNETKDISWWNALVKLLPSGWLQLRTVTLSYQNLREMYLARKNHKLKEWSVDFVEWLRELPYGEDLVMCEEPGATEKSKDALVYTGTGAGGCPFCRPAPDLSK